MTPTTAAVIAENAAFSPLLPRRFSMNGAPAKIQRKHGVNVTQVASNPPNVPATARAPMISGPGVVSAIPRPSSILPGLSLRHPVFFVDDDPVHHGNLAG